MQNERIPFATHVAVQRTYVARQTFRNSQQTDSHVALMMTSAEVVMTSGYVTKRNTSSEYFLRDDSIRQTTESTRLNPFSRFSFLRIKGFLLLPVAVHFLRDGAGWVGGIWGSVSVKLNNPSPPPPPPSLPIFFTTTQQEFFWRMTPQPGHLEKKVTSLQKVITPIVILFSHTSLTSSERIPHRMRT